MLRLYDTATATVRPLDLRTEGKVAMYVCGPTVYDRAHLGHGRMALVFDVLRRYLLFSGLEVNFVSNVTDVDDKIIERAAAEGRTEVDVAAQFEATWWEDADALGVLRPDEAPHATAYVERMVEFIEELVRRGVAYETSDGVYLDVGQVRGYGLLARQSLESLRAGARVELAEDKRSPLDFVLWKKAKPGEPTWASPWGPGRPGWHTECVVMSLDLLGDGFDLHGGGLDLAFPHHENERAQAVALGHPFARHWVHNGWVMVEGQKMSKSLQNFTTLRDLIERADARAFRLLVLGAHYRSPIEVTPETMEQSGAALSRLDALARRFSLHSPLEDAGFVVKGVGPAAQADPASVERFCDAMDDDLDTPAARAMIFELVTRANELADEGRSEEGRAVAATVNVLCAVLGLALRGSDDDVLDPEIAALVAERDRARARRDWASADEIRRRLSESGWVVEDSPEGTRIRHR